MESFAVGLRCQGKAAKSWQKCRLSPKCLASRGDWNGKDVPGAKAVAILCACQLSFTLGISDVTHAAQVPFLTRAGATGPLAEEEEYLLNLRREMEGKIRAEIDGERFREESRARESQGGLLCATPFGIDVVGIFELLCLLGAIVGGLLARSRKAELQQLNKQLRQINESLRQQARAGVVYAPGLKYAPGGAVKEQAVGGGAATATLSPAVAAAGLQSVSTDEEDGIFDSTAESCSAALKEGKRLLKLGEGPAARVRFEKAVMLAKSLGDKVRERRAVRGLAAASRLQGQFRISIKYLERVLQISSEINEFTGDSDAYGTIADIYTEMGDFEKAGKYYDQYIARLTTDGPV